MANSHDTPSPRTSAAACAKRFLCEVTHVACNPSRKGFSNAAGRLVIRLVSQSVTYVHLRTQTRTLSQGTGRSLRATRGPRVASSSRCAHERFSRCSAAAAAPLPHQVWTMEVRALVSFALYGGGSGPTRKEGAGVAYTIHHCYMSLMSGHVCVFATRTHNTYGL